MHKFISLLFQHTTIILLALSCFGQNPPNPQRIEPSGQLSIQKRAGWTLYPQLHAFDILFDRKGILWAATRDGAYRLNVADGNYTRVSPSASPYWGVSEAPDGTIWFTSISGGGAAKYDGKVWTSFGMEQGLPSNDVFDVAGTPAGVLWFSTRAGIARFDGRSWTTYTTRDGLATNQCAFAMIAPKSDIWFGTDDEAPGAGVSRFDGKRWTTYTPATGLPGPTAIPLFATADGALWFGTIGEGGVSRFDGKDWKHFHREDGLVANYAEHGVVAPDGSLWFSSTGVGLSHFDGSKWITYTPENGLPAKYVYALAFAPDGSLWTSALEGLVRYQAN